MKTPLTLAIIFLTCAYSYAQWEPDVRLTNNLAQSKAAFANTHGIVYQGDTLMWSGTTSGMGIPRSITKSLWMEEIPGARIPD